VRAWYTLTAVHVCGVSEGRKHGPSAAFFADLENRCPSVRRLYLSKAVVNAPLPASVEFLTLSECSLSPAAFPLTRLDAATQAVTSPRLRELELFSVKLQRGAMTAVPASVQRLRIKNTRLTRESLDGEIDETVSLMEEIDLSDSTTLTDSELCNLTAVWPHISTLKINGCIMTFNSIFLVMLIFDNLGDAGRLAVLEANGVSFADNICRVCRHLGGTLRRFCAAGSDLTDHEAALIAADLTSLESLDISGCQQLTDRCFIMFAGLRATLHYLDVSSTNISDDTLAMLRLWMPHCEIVR